MLGIIQLNASKTIRAANIIYSWKFEQEQKFNRICFDVIFHHVIHSIVVFPRNHTYLILFPPYLIQKKNQKFTNQFIFFKVPEDKFRHSATCFHSWMPGSSWNWPNYMVLLFVKINCNIVFCSHILITLLPHTHSQAQIGKQAGRQALI